MPDERGVNDPAAARNRVFMSYGHADAANLALRLEADLTRAGFDVWLDKSKLRAGRSWEEQIEREILSREIVVSLLTPHAVRRPDGVCLDEISFARYKGRRIVPLMVTPCQPPLGIFRLDWIDFQSWNDETRYEQGLDRLKNAIGSERDRVDGEHARLLGALRPLDFGIEVARLTRNFTGRQWLFDEIDTWLHTDKTRVFLITGDPGTGKSAIAARLIARHPSVCASHFCISSVSDSLNSFRFACSIAAQLATQLDDYRQALDAVDLESLHALDASSAWRRVVIDPLASITIATPIVIAVDALDEAMGVAGGSIAKLLRDQADGLPPSVRFVVTTRKDPDVLDSFSGYEPHEIGSSSDRDRADIAAYIEHRLQEPGPSAVMAARGAVHADLVAAITAKADGNFLYMTQAVAAMEAGRLDPQHPEEFPDGLVGIYQGFFERVFREGDGFAAFRPLLEVLCAAREALTSEQIARFLGRGRLDVETDLDRVAAFFPESERRYRPYHKSIVDWLSGRAGRSRRFRVDVGSGHRLVADSLLRDFDGGNRDRFVLAHLPAHLQDSGNKEALDALLGTPSFVLAKATAAMFQAVIDDYERSETPAFQTVREALILSSHVVTSRVEELPGQLRGRLCGFADERLVEFVRRLEPIRGTALLPQTASLTAPGGPLARTILDLNRGVHGVAIGRRRGRPVIASCGWGDDHAVRLWDLATGDPVDRPMTGHSEVLSGVAFGRLADGSSVIASCSHDATVRMWHAETGEPLDPPFEPLKGAVRGLAFVEFKGKPAILALSAYGSRLLDPDSRRPCTDREYGGLAAFATLADGRSVVISTMKGDDNTIVVRDAETGEQRGAPLVGHRLPVSALAVGTMPTGDRVLASGGYDATVRLWRLDSSQELAVFRGHADQYEEGWTTLWADRAINALTFGEFGGVHGLVSAGGDHKMRLWNLETLREFGPPLAGHEHGVNAIACGHLGETAVIVSGSDDGTIRVWKPTRSTPLATRPASHDAPVTAMAVTRILGQPAIVTGSDDGTVRVSDMDGQFVGPSLIGLRGAVRTVTTGTLDGVPVAVAGGADGTIWRWNLLTCEPLNAPIVAGGGNVSSGEVWSARIIQVLGESMIAATADYRRSEIHRWDLVGGSKRTRLVAGDNVRESVPAIAVGTVRGAPVLVAARQDDTLILWNLEERTSIAFAGHTGWTDHWQTIGLADSIALGELGDGTPIIVCPNVDRTIRVVVADTGQEVCMPLVGHTDFVFSVRFGSLHGAPACVSASVDRTVRLWDLTSGQQVATFTADAPVTCCEIDSDCGTVLAGDHSGAIHILKPVS